MKYILSNMCDVSPFYSFDKKRMSKKSKKKANNTSSKEETKSNPAKKSSGSRVTTQYYSKNYKEVSSENSNEKREYQKLKKREMKYLRKRAKLCSPSVDLSFLHVNKYLNSSNSDNQKMLSAQPNSEQSSNKIFKIERMSKSRSRSGSNSHSGNLKYFSKKKGKRSKKGSSSSKYYSKKSKGSNLIMLQNGKIILQGNQIETVVPCEFQKLSSGMNAIIPKYPVKVTIEPLYFQNPVKVGFPQSNQEVVNANFEGKKHKGVEMGDLLPTASSGGKSYRGVAYKEPKNDSELSPLLNELMTKY